MEKVIYIGVMSRKEYVARTIAIAKGEYVPKPNEPKVWFESTRSMAEVLSNDNRELLALIASKKPNSLKDLEVISGRKVSNLSRTLKRMEKFGIVTLQKNKKQVRPVVNATNVKINIDLNPHLAQNASGKSKGMAEKTI
ncbi:HVO_A0114 family putative DNA-binding protein [Geomonas subterranea]|uniref:HVO_A0114 family putative DNA-binding protein n=1 Tax=Geomonas subterranea TaxID=2847989 RepID=UPI001CD5EEAC|nr:hypothetical protein [Geomonas fuzhouensis]